MVETLDRHAKQRRWCTRSKRWWTEELRELKKALAKARRKKDWEASRVNQTAHISCIDNENDALGPSEQEPIYTEEQVAETGQSGQVAPGNTGQYSHTPGNTGQVAPEVIAPGQSGQVAEPRLQVAPGEIQPSAEKADHQTPDEVVTDPMPSSSRTVVRRTDVRTGQVPSSRTTDLRTGQEPSSSSHTTDLRTGQHTNKGQRTSLSFLDAHYSDSYEHTPTLCTYWSVF